ncbi:MAG TPA: hypothetical protein VGG30_06960 [Pirellulales bacterium]|jgi:hypothetical protein
MKRHETTSNDSKRVSLSPLSFGDALKGLMAVDPRAISPAPTRKKPAVSAKKRIAPKKKPKAAVGKKKKR